MRCSNEGHRFYQRLQIEIDNEEHDTLAFRYAPFNLWFEDENSLHEWFESW